MEVLRGSHVAAISPSEPLIFELAIVVIECPPQPLKSLLKSNGLIRIGKHNPKRQKMKGESYLILAKEEVAARLVIMQHSIRLITAVQNVLGLHNENEYTCNIAR